MKETPSDIFGAASMIRTRIDSSKEWKQARSSRESTSGPRSSGTPNFFFPSAVYQRLSSTTTTLQERVMMWSIFSFLLSPLSGLLYDYHSHRSPDP